MRVRNAVTSSEDNTTSGLFSEVMLIVLLLLLLVEVVLVVVLVVVSSAILRSGQTRLQRFGFSRCLALRHARHSFTEAISDLAR
jgi:hypothetical protein